MKYIEIGSYVNTHGIKGEIRIKSNFKFKDRIFKKGNRIFIKEKEFIINSYRVHKDFDMLTLEGINDINQILPFKGSKVYYLYDDLKLATNEYLDEDLIGLTLYQNQKEIGQIDKIEYINNHKKLLVINNHYIPFELIKKIDFENKKVEIEEVSGLI